MAQGTFNYSASRIAGATSLRPTLRSSDWKEMAAEAIWTGCLESEVHVGLGIKTAQADELARSLVRLTGESMTEAVTAARAREARTACGRCRPAGTARCVVRSLAGRL
jgi:hypothetical protein